MDRENTAGKALVSGRLLQTVVANAVGRLARQDGRSEPMWSREVEKLHHVVCILVSQGERLHIEPVLDQAQN